MKIGYIGLGKMGFNMAQLLKEQGYKVIVYNRSPDPVYEAVNLGIEGSFSLQELVSKVGRPGVFWLMVPHGAVDEVLSQLKPLLEEGNVIIDGGNSFFEDTVRRSRELNLKGIDMLDAGVSGGPEGARQGSSIMVGGQKEVFDDLEELFSDLSVDDGYAYVGRSGAGHFVKMVHNGIEYGMMQALAEGFDILKNSDFNLKFEDVLKPYANGSVIESRLVDWLAQGYEKYGQELEEVSGKAKELGEGRWTYETAKKMGIPVKVIEQALKAREKSRKKPNYQGKIITLLRSEFGGHNIKDDENN